MSWNLFSRGAEAETEATNAEALDLNALVAVMRRHASGELSLSVPEIAAPSLAPLAAEYTQVLGLYTQTIERLQQHTVRLYESQAKIEEQAADLEARGEELRLAYMHAEHANQAKSEFLANMSHELRTPLTAILGFAEELQLAENDPAVEIDRGEALRTITRAGRHLLSVINDILDLSKLEADKLDVAPVSCQTLPMLQEVIDMLRPQAEKKQIALALDFDGPLPETIRTDPQRLQQVVTNLVSNAIKFTEHGEVRVVARLVHAWETNARKITAPTLQIDVTDTGVGLADNQIERLFEPFAQADCGTFGRFGGTGLGLAISRKLANLLGGNVLLVRTSPGRGSTFRATVATGPLERVPMLDRGGQRLDPVALRHAAFESDTLPLPCRVLLAEDVLDNQQLMGFVLRRSGAEVTIVDNGRAAIAATLQANEIGQPFDIILMDMQMPEQDGYSATAGLRAAGIHTPIVALTAHAMIGDRDKCLAAGCDDYVTKPIDRSALLSTLRKHLALAALAVQEA